ncbi:MAG: Holliday junction resolvase RuvX [Bacillota bacterium]|nr:Holliday junction resolvase RuvX [Bacillota bacterium]
MRILGLDPGEKRIGVAVTDPLGLTAQGISVISYDRLEDALNEIEGICRHYEVTEVVVGNPLKMNGSRGTASEKAEKFAEKLRRKLDLPVILIDERLTTAGAERTMIAGGASRKKRRETRDKLAAALILDLYISSR